MKKVNNIQYYLDLIAASGKFERRSIDTELAKQVGVTRQLVNMWRRNEVQAPRDKTLSKVLMFININMPPEQPKIALEDLIKLSR